MIDDDEADDKIIAVLQNDYIWNWVEDIDSLPSVLIERLEHYFSTYKLVAGEEPKITIDRVYGHRHAQQVVQAAMDDYREVYG
jgi:inorganic pyrophosphatase